MSRPLEAFGKALLKKKMFKKVFANPTAGNRIAPPQAGDNDAKHQLRLDVREVVNGKKVYLQINAEAKNDVLKKYRGKRKSCHGDG